jgi:hypothetical protein
VLIASPRNALTQARVLGVMGTAAIAVGGTLAGALPVGDPHVVRRLENAGSRFDPGLVCAFFGLVLLVVAWWRLGQLVHNRHSSLAHEPDAGPTGIGSSDLLATLALWVTPLLLCPPLFSRDVYSYLAQGAMVHSGIDVYQYGPASLGGPIAAQVPAIWQHTPAPYGPVFLWYASGVARFAGTNVALGVLGMRAMSLLGVAMLATYVPALARRCGISPESALWLGVLNPLVLGHFVAGAHNDAVMLGLLVAGMTVAVAGRPGYGAALVTLAALVKAPAALGLLFLVPIWAGQVAGRWRGVRAAVAIGGVAAGTTVAVTEVIGTGYGWVRVLNTPISAGNWSLTSALGRLNALLLQAVDADIAADPKSLWRWMGLAVAGVVIIAMWTLRFRLGPVHALGLALAALVVFGPAIRPWYVLWGLVLVATASPDHRVRRLAAVTCVVLALVILPSGFAPRSGDVAQALLGMAIAATALMWWVALNGRPGFARIQPTIATGAPHMLTRTPATSREHAEAVAHAVTFSALQR